MSAELAWSHKHSTALKGALIPCQDTLLGHDLLHKTRNIIRRVGNSRLMDRKVRLKWASSDAFKPKPDIDVAIRSQVDFEGSGR